MKSILRDAMMNNFPEEVEERRKKFLQYWEWYEKQSLYMQEFKHRKPILKYRIGSYLAFIYFNGSIYPFSLVLFNEGEEEPCYYVTLESPGCPFEEGVFIIPEHHYDNKEGKSYKIISPYDSYDMKSEEFIAEALAHVKDYFQITETPEMI
jgi:hypothetical protein